MVMVEGEVFLREGRVVDMGRVFVINWEVSYFFRGCI